MKIVIDDLDKQGGAAGLVGKATLIATNGRDRCTLARLHRFILGGHGGDPELEALYSTSQTMAEMLNVSGDYYRHANRT